MLWIPSKIWFELLRRRIREIQRTQINIVKRNPPNLGVLTGLLNHMLRSTMTTPMLYDFHVRESLALLDYRNVLETAGMFFLHNLDVSSETCLQEVQQVDDVAVLALMGVDAKARRDRAVLQSLRMPLSEETESEEYPIGRRPTWSQLREAISKSPGMIMRPWTWLTMLSNLETSVGRLFIMFTRQMWLMVEDQVFKGVRPYPLSLQEAMKCWTITSVDEALPSVAFDACNAGLDDHHGVTPGRMGPRSKSFVSRYSVFFPTSDASYRNHAQWSNLFNGDGYIAQFHRMIEHMDDEQQASLTEGLSDIFAHLHCLPASSTNRVWTQRKEAAVFITNPTFYKIECIGKSGDAGRKRVPRARRMMKMVKGKRAFMADLMDSMPCDTNGNLRRKTDRQKRRELLKKMPMVKKNTRVPPPPRPRKVKPFPMPMIEECREGGNDMDVD